MRIPRLLVGLGLMCLNLVAEPVKTPIWAHGGQSGLSVALGGESVPVLSVETPEDQLIVLLVMDTVKYPDRTDAARDAIIEALTRLGPQYYAGVMSAQDGLTVHLDPVRARAKLREKLDSLSVRGVPGLLDVVEQVSSIADQTLAAAKVRVASLFVTDGEIADYRGGYTIPIVNPSDQRDLSRRFRSQLILQRIRTIAAELQVAQAPLFFLHLARKYDSLNEVYQNGINEFAQVTGGRALFARGVQEVPAMVQSLLDEIAAHSVLTLEMDCDGIRRLEVRSNGASARHKAMVSCPPTGS